MHAKEPTTLVECLACGGRWSIDGHDCQFCTLGSMDREQMLGWYERKGTRRMTYRYTSDLSDGFFEAMAAACSSVGAQTLDVIRVAYAESGCKASEPNHLGSGACGLIQWMPDDLKNMGWSAGSQAFLGLTAEQQVPFIRKYFQPYKGRLTTLAAVYCAVFMPVCIDQASDPEAIVSSPKDHIRGWAYAMNMSLDANHDGKIVVSELESAVTRNCTGARWNEIFARATGEHPPAHYDASADLGTTFGLQSALTALGFNPGPIDGLNGPVTIVALMRFQQIHGLKPDGLPGPLSRAALTAALTQLRNAGPPETT